MIALPLMEERSRGGPGACGALDSEIISLDIQAGGWSRSYDPPSEQRNTRVGPLLQAGSIIKRRYSVLDS